MTPGDLGTLTEEMQSLGTSDYVRPFLAPLCAHTADHLETRRWEPRTGRA